MKNLIFKSALLVFLCAGITFGQGYLASAQKAVNKNKDIAGAFNLAKEAYSKDSINAAYVILLLIKDKKNDAELLDLLAKVCYKNGITENAIMYFQEADKLDSLNIERKFTLAEMFFKEQRYTDAVNEYLKVEKLDAKNKKALENISSIFFRGKLYPAAAMYYEKVILLDKKLENYINCAIAFDSSKNFVKTLEIVKEGLKTHPNNEVLARKGFYAGVKSAQYEDALNLVILIPDEKLSAYETKTAGDIAAKLNIMIDDPDMRFRMRQNGL